MNPQPSVPYCYIDTGSRMESLIASMEKAERIALDTEADSLHHYFEKVCLIQICVDGENYIVDPLSGTDLSDFLSILSSKNLVLHGADYDLRILRSSFGFRPEGAVFDTMLAARLLGYESLGLSRLIEHFFGVALSKQGQHFDWSRRPLPPKQLEYASNDTRYLEPMADRLIEELRRQDRLAWHRETCEAMTRSAFADKAPADPDEVWRIKGSSHLGEQQLSHLRALWFWREQEARDADLPPFKIMGNSRLVEIALLSASKTVSFDLRRLKLPRHIRGHRLEALHRALVAARNLPSTEWPDRRRAVRPCPPSGPEIHKLKAERDRIARELDLDPSVVAPRAALESMARTRPETVDAVMACSSLMPWQAKLMEDAIQQLFREPLSEG